MSNNISPVVSVCMITYNHEKFIAQAIESIVSQQTDFRFELVIGEDFSKDRTREIILSYKEKYPDFIKLLLPETNLGLIGNFTNTILACAGKYIAYCEGDDYWVDPLKLQKQVNLLEKNGSIILCGSNVDIVDSNNNILASGEENKGFLNGEITFLEVLTSYRFYTGTIMFRNFFFPYGNLKQFPEEINTIITADWFLALLCGFYYGDDKKYYNFNEKFACYRKHDTGVWSPIKVWQQQLMFIELYKQFNKVSKCKYELFINKELSHIYFQTFKSHVLSRQYAPSLKFLFKSFKLRIALFLN